MRALTFGRHVAVVFVALGTVACTALLGDFSVEPGSSSGGPGEAGTEGGQNGGVLGVTPAEAKLGILRTQSFAAAQEVTWSVQEGPTGGSIDDKGRYLSPDHPGVFHVVATSKADPSVTSVGTVTVVGLAIGILVGVNGGEGNIDGPAPRAHFSQPESVVHLFDPQTGSNSDQWYIADTRNHTIRHYDGKTQKVRTVAGKAGEPGTAVGLPTTARFTEPRRIVADPKQKRLYVLDNNGTCIRMIDLANGDTVRTISGTCGVSGFSDGVGGMPAQLSNARSMAMSGDRQSAIYVSDNNTLRRIDLQTGSAQTMLSNGGELAVDYFSGGQNIKNVFYSDGITLRRFPEAPLPVPPFNITAIAPIPEGFTDGLAVSTGYGNDNDVYSVSRNRGVIYRLRIGNSQFDANPFAGGLDDRRVVNGSRATARFAGPVGIEAAPEQGFFLVADSSASAIRRVRTSQDLVDTPVGAARVIDNVDGPRDVARLTGPFAVAVDESGVVYFGDAAFDSAVPNNTIRKFDRATSVVTRLSGQAGRGFDPTTPPVDGPKDQARFGFPIDMTYASGKLFVIDAFGQAVRQVTVATGEVKTIAGELNVSGSSDGVGIAAHFNFFDKAAGDSSLISGGIATDWTNLYVSDTSNHSIRKVVIATGATTTLAGGTAGSANGKGTAAQFTYPFGLAYADGMLYVADLKDHTIRRLDVATGEVTGFIGLSGLFGDVDGDAATATLNYPGRLVADGLGNLYVTEIPLNDNQPKGLVRRIDLKARTIKAFAGTMGAVGLASGALPSTVNCPVSLALTPAKDLVFADFCESTLAIIQPL
jgi:hypothetical protein